MTQSLALYRRYRPETFAEVIGQDHVTTPLRTALANDRVNHAYLFSGPRGCGKTTSARILARALNCEKAPISDPCGECQSCRDLARGGPGSIDVIEIDAASHGGVDDARDLRERACFAPVSSRFKVYIIDEAHMVTTQGFNALLKLVEEPPEHLKFVFATTEPEKVLPTIRSRTHHYPFRLIPPRTLSDYLQQLCEAEGVQIDQAALPLVVRAGAGSARDSLSVLDQLLGGAGPDGVTYEIAAGLLGYTPDNLLDEVVDAFAAGDGRDVFAVVDKVIETGQDPRRFTEDVLRRLRDLVIIAAVPDAPATGLVDAPEDQVERLVAQAARFGRAELVRAADLVAAGLTEMRGATAPRLLLELVCARVLLPGSDDSTLGLAARMDRLERRMSMAPPRADSEPARETPPPAAPPARSAPAAPAATVEPAPPPETVPTTPVEPPAPAPPPAAAAPTPAARPADPAPRSPAPTGMSLADVRRTWPDLLEKVKTMRRYTWILLSQQAQVVGADEGTLTVGFKSAGARDSFVNGGSDEILRQAAIDLLGADWRVEAITDPGADPGAQVAPRVTQQSTAGPAAQREPASGAGPNGPGPTSPGDPADAHRPPPPARSEAMDAARDNITATRGERPPADDPDDAVDRDDPEADDSGLAGAALLERELGATVIEDIPHS